MSKRLISKFEGELESLRVAKSKLIVAHRKVSKNPEYPKEASEKLLETIQACDWGMLLAQLFLSDHHKDK